MKNKLLLLSLLMLPLSMGWTASNYPSHYSTYVQSAKWITRDGNISLSITPTSYARKMSQSEGLHAFKLITSQFKSDSRWHNYYALRDQYICHLLKTTDKPQWNIEPGRQNLGLQKVIDYKCNPPWK